jgi:hypothetical protein
MAGSGWQGCASHWRIRKGVLKQGLFATHKDQFNTDLLDFIRT